MKIRSLKRRDRIKKCCQKHINAAAETWLAIGYVKEDALREEIALQIEDDQCDTPNHGDSYLDMKHAVAQATYERAAAIARGQM